MAAEKFPKFCSPGPPPPQTLSDSVHGSPIPRFDSLLEKADPEKAGKPAVRLVVTEADSTQQDLEQSLEKENLSVTDLKELRVVQYGLSEETVSSGYPESGLHYNLGWTVSQKGTSSYDGPDSIPSSALLQPAVPIMAFGKIPHDLRLFTSSIQSEVLYCDLRNKCTGLYRMHSAAFSKDSSGSYTTSAAAFFCCDKESVTELVLKSRTHGEVRAMVIGIRETNTHFIVQYEKEFCFLCLVLGPESSGQEGLQICHKWLEQLQKGSPQVSAKSLNSYCLLSHFRRLNELDLSSSDRNLSLVYLVKAEPITVKIIHCLDTFTEKTYYIECNDTCSVREVKQQFLQLYRQEQHVAVDVGSVWFTLGEKVLPDDQALKWREQAIRFDDEDSMDLVHILPENTFYIHFQPANAVPVKVHFRSVARRNTQLKSERLLIISPTATADDLRLEIAKIIHKDPFSCKLFISGKKIEADTNLEDLLSGSSCTVVVEQRDKISLTVDTTSQRVSVQMHKYESVAKLKAEVCNTLQVPLYTVDLKHSNTNLQEQQNLRTSRLRDSDTVQAVLLPHRMRVRVRLSSGHWEDIVVDNQTVSTVGHLKGFAQHLIQQQLSASSRDELGGLSTLIEYNVIFNGCVLCDDNTLKDAGVTMNSKIVLVQTEKHCFTAGWGRVPIFLSEANGVLRREFVMSDGKVFYFGPQFFSQPRECGSAAEPSRSPIIFHNDNTKQSTEGLHLCPQNLKTQFPPDYQRPQTSSPEQRQYVCTICKSSSIPSFRTQDNTDAESDLARSRSEVLSNTMPPTEDMSYKGCSHAQNGSCVLKQAENSSLTFQTFQKDVANKTSTPGKEPAGEDFGVASLPVCSISNIFNPHNQSTASSGLDTASQAQAQMSQNLTEGGCTAQTVVQPDSRADENGNPTGNISSTQAVLTYQPGTPVTTQRSISSGYVSEYESTDRWKAYKRKVSFVESVKRAPDGHLICTKTFKSEQNVDPESAQFFVPNPTGSITYPGLGTAFEHAMIPASADFTYLDPEDKTFAYISKKTIIYVAKHIVHEAQLLFLHLGLPDHVYQTAQQSTTFHAPFDIHYHCLRVWCRSKRDKASPVALMKALEEVDRGDLKDIVEEYERGYQTC